MGYALLWIEAMAAALLLVALVAACSARLAKRWVRVVLPTLTAAGPGGFSAYLTVGFRGLLLLEGTTMYRWLFWYAGSWTVGFAPAAAFIIYRALRAGGAAPTAEGTVRPAGAGWPRAKLAVAATAVVLLGATTVWNMSLAAHNKLAAIRAEAGALALSLMPSRPPDSENAALVYERAFELMPKVENVPELPGEGDKGAARAYLTEHELALKLLRQAAAMPGCYFEYPSPVPDIEALMPILPSMRQGARLLALDAQVKAADGQAGLALRDVAAIFGLARHAGTSPALIQGLVAIAAGAMGHVTLEDVLAHCEPSAADLEQLPVDETFSYWRLLRRMVRMEDALCLATGANMAEKTGDVFFMPGELPGLRSMMLEYDAALAHPYYLAREGIEQVEQKAQDGRWGILPAMQAPAWTTATAAAAQAEAKWLLDNMALAATAYRIRHGRFPAAPGDLVPEFMTVVPADPFSGQPMKMRPTDEGVILYSIGPDMKDNGGSDFDPERKTGDLTFRLRTPPRP
jgi:hypothetical protein